MVRLLEVYGWTGLFFVGSCLSLWNLRECVRDLEDLQDYKLNGPARAAARYEIGSETIRFAELFGGFGAGLLSIFHINWPVIYLLFLLPIGLTFNTYRAYRYRSQWGHGHTAARRQKGEGHAD